LTTGLLVSIYANELLLLVLCRGRYQSRSEWFPHQGLCYCSTGITAYNSAISI